MKEKFYRIRKRLLVYALGSIIITISLVVVLINGIIGGNIKKLTIEKYQYINEKIVARIENNFKASDELFKKYIDHSAIQATLESGELEVGYKEELQRMLTYINFEDMTRAVYINNKGNTYGAKLICFNYKQFIESDLYKVLDDTYSTTRWSWQKDSLFGMEDESLFIMRYIRHMEYPVAPGVMILKMSDHYLERMLEDLEKDVHYFLV